jgi:hypothetical protein
MAEKILFFEKNETYPYSDKPCMIKYGGLTISIFADYVGNDIEKTVKCMQKIMDDGTGIIRFDSDTSYNFIEVKNDIFTLRCIVSESFVNSCELSCSYTENKVGIHKFITFCINKTMSCNASCGERYYCKGLVTLFQRLRQYKDITGSMQTEQEINNFITSHNDKYPYFKPFNDNESHYKFIETLANSISTLYSFNKQDNTKSNAPSNRVRINAITLTLYSAIKSFKLPKWVKNEIISEIMDNINFYY